MTRSPDLEMLMAREQLMEDIESIVDNFDWSFNGTETLVARLCDAVCKHFPAPTK